MPDSTARIQDDDRHLQLLPEVALQGMSDQNLDSVIERAIAEREERRMAEDPLSAYAEVEVTRAVSVTTEEERRRRRRLAREPRCFRQVQGPRSGPATTASENPSSNAVSTDGAEDESEDAEAESDEGVFDEDCTYIGAQLVGTTELEREVAVINPEECRTCGICNADFTSRSAAQLSPIQVLCGHIFCLGCLTEWTTERVVGVTRRGSCPTCSADSVRLLGVLRLQSVGPAWSRRFLPLSHEVLASALITSAQTHVSAGEALRRTLMVLRHGGLDDPIFSRAITIISHNSGLYLGRLGRFNNLSAMRNRVSYFTASWSLLWTAPLISSLLMNMSRYNRERVL